ncbi:ABC transporter ATP-binding protein [Sessilibacter corallicola]|uniref:ABC transporter ATP-binding protein n=1 Tax=Sessilibacter corallicola TaxID=2904075 RepID=A0ABQ0ADY1_9GAMM
MLKPSPIKTFKISQFIEAFAYSRQAIELVWSTSRKLTIVLMIATLCAGLLPALIAILGQYIVDSVVSAHELRLTEDAEKAQTTAIYWVLAEACVIVVLAASQRVISVCQSLLRAQLGEKVNVLILEKAQTLSLSQFEDSEFYDKLTRARREASVRPLALINKLFGLLQNSISLISYGIILWHFSFVALIILFISSIPVFISEAKFSGDAFRLFRWRSPETRQKIYLETLLAREDSAKEVKLFQLGNTLLKRYQDIFQKLYEEDKKLTLRRDFWGWALGNLGTLAFYSTYVWIIIATIQGSISLGEMTMYLLVFKQGQSAISASLTAISGMYEDNLYLHTLYEYLNQPVEKHLGTTTIGEIANDGIRFHDVSFQYPGSEIKTIKNLNLHIKPGQKLALVGENGSGKTTLIKLLTYLYKPTHGKITFDGTDLNDWHIPTLHKKMSVIFQDFMKYQFIVGENLGAGNVDKFNDASAWSDAAEKGLSAAFINNLSDGYETQLGRWFKGGQELSGGQWQKIALSRMFIRPDAELLILDEPTSAMDAKAEAEIFSQLTNYTEDRIAIFISHRFSTVRTADHIIVLKDGTIEEQGSHEQLLALNKTYAHLFKLQAKGYQ